MYSIVDRKQRRFIEKYGKTLGMFLLEQIAKYEADFFEEGHSLSEFFLLEKGSQDEEIRISNFREKHTSENVFHTFITHNTLKQSFHLLVTY